VTRSPLGTAAASLSESTIHQPLHLDPSEINKGGTVLTRPDALNVHLPRYEAQPIDRGWGMDATNVA